MNTPAAEAAIAQLPALVEHAPGVAMRLSHQGDSWRTWYVTRNIVLYGYSVEELIDGRVRWLDMVHPDDRVLLGKTISDYEAHGVNTFKLHYRLITRAGETVPVTEYNTVNRDADGRILCYDSFLLSNNQDEASRLLIDAHSRQQLVLNDILISLQDADLDHALQIILNRTGAYLDTSRALLFKDSPDHKTCKIVYEWCNRDITSVMVLDYSITYATGMPEIYIALQTTGSLLVNAGEIPENCREEFEAEGLVASAIFAVYLNGDHYGFVCFDDCVVERTWDDDTVRFLKNIANLISNVLARQQAAAQLRQNQRVYETVLDNVDSYLFVKHLQTRTIHFANKAFKAAFGEDCVGRPATDYLPIDDLERQTAALQAAGRRDYPEVYCARSGEWLAVSLETITWVDGSEACLVNCYNITAKKLFADTLEQKIEERTRALKLMTAEAEKAREKAEDATLAKSQFLANMSHEIRTPMNAIIGLAEVLATTDLNATQREHVKNIKRSSDILLNIINDILDISKLEAGRLTLVNVNYNLGQTVDQVSSLFRSIAAGKGLEYRFEASAPLSLCLYGDDIRLRQVLINILGNAAKFTDKGYIKLAVELADEQVIFRISDTGIGIRDEALEVIFEPFSQTDLHRNRKIQGTGLGLPICKSLIELMGGSIAVSSTYGQGSLFTIAIPRVPGDASLLEVEQTSETGIYAPDAEVLVVDDSDINLYVAEALLEGFGVRTTLALSGAEALELARTRRFDLIFMDHMMPDMDGVEATRALRSQGGPGADTPVIALTANVISEARQLFTEAGMDDFLAKPIELDKLAATLKRWLPADKLRKG